MRRRTSAARRADVGGAGEPPGRHQAAARQGRRHQRADEDRHPGRDDRRAPGHLRRYRSTWSRHLPVARGAEPVGGDDAAALSRRGKATCRWRASWSTPGRHRIDPSANGIEPDGRRHHQQPHRAGDVLRRARAPTSTPPTASTNATPLYAAVEMRNPDYTRDTPPPAADARDPMDLIKALLTRGANPNARANTTPFRGFYQVSANWANFDGQTPFLRAALVGRRHADAPAARTRRRSESQDQRRRHAAHGCGGDQLGGRADLQPIRRRSISTPPGCAWSAATT